MLEAVVWLPNCTLDCLDVGRDAPVESSLIVLCTG